jgi:hypothetical protein
MLAILFLEPSCSRQDEGSSAASAQPAQGGSADPGGGKIDGATAPAAPGGPMKYEKPPVTDISELFNTNNAEALWTRGIDLTGVTVQQIFADKQFILVGPDKEHSVMVQVSEQHPEINVGQKVDVTGVINPTGRDKTQWNVSPDEQKLLTQHSIFVLAKSIRSAAAK